MVRVLMLLAVAGVWAGFVHYAPQVGRTWPMLLAGALVLSAFLVGLGLARRSATPVYRGAGYAGDDGGYEGGAGSDAGLAWIPGGDSDHGHGHGGHGHDGGGHGDGGGGHGGGH